ncbi:CBS domain-containing protein [Dechloromonas denitrificans]|uniref:CBS domain-containing protein n=1 Tax=Dechloromonas denitrificans TaxID=281362 RepID=UPI0009F8F6EC|nr:CBS domain-containing protein [Dechloromonas denitrificans]
MFETDTNTEHLFAHHPIRQFVESSPAEIKSVQPGDTVLSALRVLAENDLGVVVVLDGERLVGVMSERDYARKVILAGRRSENTTVGEIMSREVVTTYLGAKFGDCMRLMNQHHIRHLPVLDGDRLVRVISIMDVLREAVAHHEKVIGELERERMTVFNAAY